MGPNALRSVHTTKVKIRTPIQTLSSVLNVYYFVKTRTI